MLNYLLKYIHTYLFEKQHKLYHERGETVYTSQDVAEWYQELSLGEGVEH